MSERERPHRRRKYTDPELRVLAFELAGHTYAVDLALVEEIIPFETSGVALDIAPAYVEGLLKRRGRIVPIVDLRKKLALPVSSRSVETSVIISRLRWGLLGFVVDGVSEALRVNVQDFEIPSPLVVPIDQVYIQGIAHFGDRALVLVDLEQLFVPEELAALETLQASLPQSRDQALHVETLLDEQQVSEGEVEETAPETQRLAPRRRLVTFELSGGLYGIPITFVTEISRVLPLMPLPHVPSYVLGLVNLRGTVLPVIDLRRRFGLAIKPESAENRLLFLRNTGELEQPEGIVALWVEAVRDLARLPGEAFQALPPGVARIDSDYYGQVSLLHGQLLVELNIKKLLTDTALKSERQIK